MDALGRTLALGTLISITILVPDVTVLLNNPQQMTPGEKHLIKTDHVLCLPTKGLEEGKQGTLQIIWQINTPVSVQMGTKAQLCCPPISLIKTVSITWKITLRGQTPCTISYKVATKEISEANCTDRRITWASTPGQSPHLQINTVALSHDGQYLCEVASHEGHFQERHDLHVVVPPEVTLFPGKNRTVVCEAIAGRPAAQIFWAPDGYHVTENESHSNGTVTVRSIYHWEPNNESAVLCFVSHVTGNKTLQITLNRDKGVTSPLNSLLTILYVKLSLLGIILLIIGFVFFQRETISENKNPDF